MTAITQEQAEREPDNVRLFPQTQPTAAYPKRSYTISVTSPAGFPIEITYNDFDLNRLEDALAALMERGYMPAENPTPAAAPASAAPAQYSEDNPPTCPYHGPMKPSKKPGAFYCPKKM